MSRLFMLILFCTSVLTVGCEKESPQPAPVPPQRAASKLTVLVVDDAPLAAGIKQLRGEWAERTGGQIEILQWKKQDLLSANELPADIILYPSRYVGTLVDHGWLRPVRDSVLKKTDLALDDILPLVRNATLRYGNQVYALPLGEPPLMVTLNSPSADLGKFTWDEIPNLVQGKESQLRFPHAVSLLARGLAYAGHSHGEAAWFEVDSMQPRITEPAYVKALQEMQGSEGPSADEQLEATIGWPNSQSPESVTYLPLPVADKAYDPLRETWKSNDSTEPITFIGFTGRSLSVTRSTRNSSSAFKLLVWLASENISTQLSPRSQATLWFRKSQARKAGKWLSEHNRNDETIAILNSLLSTDNYYLLPRILGIDEYLETLDNAVETAIAEQQPPEKALGEAARQWNALTDRKGRDRQRVAYRKHLGLDDSNE